MIRVIYDPVIGIPVRDGECDAIAESILPGSSHAFSTENIFIALKFLVATGRLGDSLMFEYNGCEIPVNGYGSVVHWPKGFLEYSFAKSLAILHAQVERSKARRCSG